MPTTIKRFLNADDYTVSTQATPVALPNALVINPGVYSYAGVNYDMTTPGLYSGWDQANAGFNRVVWGSDVDALMSGLAWLCVDGLSDEALSLSAKNTAAMTRRIAMLCNSTVDWAKNLADSLGLQTRIVRTLTAATPTNYYDGHVMLEIKVAGEWRVFDLANGLKYTAPNGSRALKDTIPLVAGVARDPIADQAYEHASPSTGWNVTAWRHLTARTPAQFAAETERVLQIPGIVHTDGLTDFYLPAGMAGRASYVTGLGYRVMTHADWLARFYP